MTPAESIRKARAGLVIAQPFFGTLALGLELAETTILPDGRPCDTMATDGRALYFNPAFVAGLSDMELQAVLAHEVEHCARKHHVRRGARDRELWNKATDYAINGDLLAAGFRLPAGALVDQAGEFAGLGAEGIYSVLYDRANPSAPETGEDTESDGEAVDGEPDAGGDDPQAGDDSDGDGTGGEESPGEGDTGAAGGEGEGDGTGEPGGDAAGATGAGKPGGEASSPSTGSPDMRNCDPGACGEILDAAPEHEPAKAAEVAADWDQRVRQALAVAKAAGAGTLPGALQSIRNDLAAPAVDPAETFARFIDQSASRDFSWTRPSRRTAASGVAFLPGTVPARPAHIVAVVDTSGSITKGERDKFAGFLQEALDAGAADRLTVVFADTRVQRVDEYETGDAIELDSPAGGGTAFRDALAYVDREIPDASAVAYLTDCDTSDWGEEPAAPVLWLVTGADPRRATSYAARAPFGEAVLLDAHA